MFKTLLYIGVLLCWGGCIAVPSQQQRLQTANRLVMQHGWQRHDLNVAPFVLTTFLPSQAQIDAAAKNGLLTVYIEGDGLAWVTRSKASPDPTPINPIGLRLALEHPDGLAAYLARPCQFTGANAGKNCDAGFWTDGRFAEEVSSASDQAISALKEMTSSTTLRLVGYSGGGAIAALVAARRDDVSQLITIAGNLDHTAWAIQHRISPLKNSLNPVDAWQALQDIPQIHLTGGKDKIVGDYVLTAYLERFPLSRRPGTLRFPEYTHQCCWAENWADIYWQATEH